MNRKTVRALLPFLVMLAALAYNLEAEIENSFPNGAMTRNAINADLPAARTNLDVYSKAESRIYSDAIATASALALSNHAAQNDTHGCTIIASEARIADAVATHASLSSTHNATTLASEAYVTGYAAKLAGDAAQDFSTNVLTVDADSVPMSINSSNGNTNKIEMKSSGVTDGYLGSTDQIPFRVADNGANVKFQVNASGVVTLGGNLKTGSNWISGDGDNEGIYVDAAGEVLIATTTDAGDYKLQINGNAYVNGTISGADTWHNASGTYQNGWEDFNLAGFNPGSYIKDALGFVHCRGLVKSGTINTTIFALPVGYRPNATIYLPSVSDTGTVTLITIDTSGNILPVTGSNGWVSLDNLTFQAGN